MKLRLLTLNTWGLPFPIALHPRRWRFPRIARFLREGGFHVAALQEVWRGAPRLELPGLVAPDRRHGDSGLALMSAFPVLELGLRAFRAARGIDAWKQKGVLHARLSLAPGELHVFGTHLQAGHGTANALVRARQVDELLELAECCQGPGVALGDFNLASEPEDLATADRLARAGWHDLAPSGPTHVWYAERFDRIFVRDGSGLRWNTGAARVEQFGGVPFLSDHLPVGATVELRTAI